MSQVSFTSRGNFLTSERTDDLRTKAWDVGSIAGVGFAVVGSLSCEVVDRLPEGARDHVEDVGAHVLDFETGSVTHC